MIDAFAAWFCRRFRHHFFVAVGAFALLLQGTTLLVPFAVGLIAFWHLPARVVAETAALVAVAQVIAVGAGLVASVKLRRLVGQWVGGDHSEPAAVRDALLAGPEEMAMRGGVLGSPFLLVVVVPWLSHQLHFHDRGLVAVELMAMVALALASFLMANGLRQITVPLLIEIAETMPGDVRPNARTWGLSSLFSVGLFLGAAVGGIAGGLAGSSWTHSREGAALAAILAAGGIAVYGVLLNSYGLVKPALAPLRDLVGATKRIADGDYSQMIPVTSTDEFGELVIAFNTMTIGLQQRSSLHAAFGSYVDPSLTQRLLNQDTSIFAGEAVDASVFFADVRGFTNYAENVEPEEAVARLNQLFSIVVPAIRSAGGHPNRYIGDGVLAVFGTPEPLANHANRAVGAAVTIQRAVRERFGETLRLGIGINSGRVIAGTIGGGGKLDFTVIGDVVNVASRLEELTKQTGDCILLSDTTRASLRADEAIVLDRGSHMLRGREAAVRVFAIDV